MKFGVRECADVVFRAKANQKIGNRIFYKNEPVIYFDTLKTSSLEGAATTVYAQGGRGNPRLMSWDGERTVTFTMEDALISPMGLSILSGAGLIEANAAAEKTVIQHITETTEKINNGRIQVKAKPYTPTDGQESIYVMKLTNGEVDSEPILYKYDTSSAVGGPYYIVVKDNNYVNDIAPGTPVLVDYYTEHATNAFEINITPDKFGGAFYMEASTLWRDQGTQKDYAAEFVIPNLRVQSNFTFTMASSGDPSSFTFTCDAFPDYTRFDPTKKVLAQIQVLGASLSGDNEYTRIHTNSQDYLDPSDDTIKRDPSLEVENEISANVEVIEIPSTTEGMSITNKFTVSEKLGWDLDSITYSSSNTSIVSINSTHSDQIDAEGAGLAEITAEATFTKAGESNVTDTATLIVKVVAAAAG